MRTYKGYEYRRLGRGLWSINRIGEMTRSYTLSEKDARMMIEKLIEWGCA